MKTLSFLLCLTALLAGATTAQADWGRPGPGHGPGPGGRGPGWDRGGHHGPRGPGWDRGWDRGRDRHDHFPQRRWRDAGQSCGPQQPWGVSMMCPNMSPNGGPMGMPCGHLPRGTRCFGASYWHNGYNCTNPYNGQGSYGSFVFNMYVCD